MENYLLLLIFLIKFAFLCGNVNRFSLNEIETGSEKTDCLSLGNFYSSSKLLCLLKCLNLNNCYTVVYISTHCILCSFDLESENSLPVTFSQDTVHIAYFSRNPNFSCFVSNVKLQQFDEHYDPCLLRNKFDPVMEMSKEDFCFLTIFYPGYVSIDSNCGNKYIIKNESRIYYQPNQTKFRTFDENLEYCASLNMKPFVSLNLFCTKSSETFAGAKFFWTGLKLESENGDFESAVLQSDHRVFASKNTLKIEGNRRKKILHHTVAEDFSKGYRCVLMKPSRVSKYLSLANCSTIPKAPTYSICEEKEDIC